jgi:hypothetical protein
MCRATKTCSVPPRVCWPIVAANTARCLSSHAAGSNSSGNLNPPSNLAGRHTFAVALTIGTFLPCSLCHTLPRSRSHCNTLLKQPPPHALTAGGGWSLISPVLSSFLYSSSFLWTKGPETCEVVKLIYHSQLYFKNKIGKYRSKLWKIPIISQKDFFLGWLGHIEEAPSSLSTEARCMRELR